MARAVILFTSPWSDLSLDQVAQKANEWGYQGLELCCWGDHLEVQRALSEADYCPNVISLLAQYDLTPLVLANHRVGQAVGDMVDGRHQALVPDYVWGDGRPEEVRERASQEMMATVQAAQKLGAAVVSGFTGSPLWSYVAGYPAPSSAAIRTGLEDLAHRWKPILDTCRDSGIRFAAEVHPGQAAFDIYSAEAVLDAFGGREEFGFTFDPSHFHWQGVDPGEFLRRFAERIYHVHIKDAALTLHGKNSILNSYLPAGDSRRGWHFRSPGHGGVDWEAIIRTLNEIGYTGPLSVDWNDPGMSRDYGAEDASKFVKRLDFEPAHDRML